MQESDVVITMGCGDTCPIYPPDRGVESFGVLDGNGYETWVAGLDPATGEPRGRLRHDANAVWFVEITATAPKPGHSPQPWTLTLQRPTTRPRTRRQRRPSAGSPTTPPQGSDPGDDKSKSRSRRSKPPPSATTPHALVTHRHLHLQVNARVLGDGSWRGLHTVGFRDSLEAFNGIGHAAVMCDPAFRAALAAAGFTLDPATGEITELAPYVRSMSERAAQIGRNIDKYEAEWRAANPGQEPGPAIRRSWDRRAWKEVRSGRIRSQRVQRLRGRCLCRPSERRSVSRRGQSLRCRAARLRMGRGRFSLPLSRSGADPG